jgi:outer membrane immunogenic protein
MNKLISGFVAATILPIASSAYAADIARPVYKAPVMVAPTANWSGFYVGGNVGYGWGDASSFNAPAGLISEVFFSNFGPNDFNTSFRQRGWNGGVQTGYNWQFSNAGVLGIEADIQFAGVKGSVSNPAFLSPGDFGTSFRFESAAQRELQWFGTVRGRMGFLISPTWLLYGTGGLAYGSTETKGAVSLMVPNAFATISSDSSYFVCSTTSSAPPVRCYTGTNTQTQVGWTLGGGMEWLIAANWTAKFEYLHVELPSQSVTLVSPSPPSSSGVNTIYNFHRQGYDFVRFGLNYRFGDDGKTPVAAKY